MAKTITVVFDGETLKPSAPVDLEPDRSYQVTIESSSPVPAAGTPREVSIRDIAREARVSVATVSRVLKGVGPVAEEIRDRVTAAVERLNYVPHGSASPVESRSDDAWSELSALAGTVEAPPDWAVQHDHYLYGSPKRA